MNNREKTFPASGVAGELLSLDTVISNTLPGQTISTVECTTGDVRLTNQGATAELIVTPDLNGVAMLNKFADGKIIVENLDGAKLHLNGSIRNENSGSISIHNHGVLDVTGDLLNFGTGNIFLDNSASLLENATMNIGGNIFNYGSGSIDIDNFNNISGNVWGENINLTGGKTTGSVVGNIHGQETAATVNIITLDSTDIGTETQRAIIAGAAAAQTTTFAGNTDIDIFGDATIVGDIYGGGYNSDVNGTVSLTLGKEVVTAPFAIGLTDVTSITGNVYGGGINAIVKSSITLNVIGTSLNALKVTGSVYGGCNNGDVAGNVTLNISGNPQHTWITGDIYGGSYNGDIGTSSSKRNVTFNVSGGRFDGNIYMAGDRASGSKGNLYGNATFTLTGSGANLQFGGTIYAKGANSGAIIGGTSNFNFDGFSGNFAGTVDGFSTLTFLKQTHVVMTAPSQLNNICKYIFNYGSDNPSSASLTFTGQSSPVAANFMSDILVQLALGRLKNSEYILVQGNDALMAHFNNQTIAVGNPGSLNSVDTAVVNGTKTVIQGNSEIYATTNANNQLILNCDPTSSVYLKWPTDFWQRNAPTRAVQYTTASGTFYLLGNTNYQYINSSGTTSTKAQLTSTAAGTVYGGSSSANVTGDTWLNVNGSGTAGLTIYGGGNGKNVNGSANIYIFKVGSAATPKINAVYGGGSGTSSVSDTYITIAGAELGSNSVYGGGNGATATVTHSSNITLTGPAAQLNFTGNLYGSGSGGGTAGGARNLFFGDMDGKVSVAVQRNFTGDFNGNFRSFTNMTLRAGSQVRLANSANVFQAGTWQINGSLTANGATATVNATDTQLQLNVAVGGVVTDQFISAPQLSIANAGTMNGAKSNAGQITLVNTGTMNGELNAVNFNIGNQTTGLLTNVSLANAATIGTLQITNRSEGVNTITNKGTVNLTAPGNWLTNYGQLSFINAAAASFTAGSVANSAIINNSGGTTRLENFGTWNYTGRINGNPDSDQGHITLQNHNGTMNFNGVYDPLYDRKVLLVGKNPTPGSSLAVINGSVGETSGTMNIFGAIYALSTVQLTVTNYGVMHMGDAANVSDLRSTLNSSGPGGVVLDNYNRMDIQGIKNEWDTLGSSSGAMTLNNHSGTLTGYGRLFSSAVPLNLAPSDYAAILAVLDQEVVAAVNIGGGASAMTVNNAAGATFGLKGTALNAMGAKLSIANNGIMTLGATYDNTGVYSDTGTFFRDALYNYRTSDGIVVTNSGTLHINGAVYNDDSGNISITNTASGAILEIFANSLTNYALLNNSSGNITVTNTAGTLNIHGNVVNKKSGSINIADYTAITGDIIGKNITLSGSGTVNGNVRGGEITAGETSTVSITGGTIGSSGNVISGVSGNVAAGATDVTIHGNTTVNSIVYCGGDNIGVTGQSAATIGGNGDAIGLNSHVFGGGNGASGTTRLVNMTFGSGVSSGANANIYGGGNGGNVNGNVTMNISGGSYNSVFGGGLNSDCAGVSLTVSGSAVRSIQGGSADNVGKINGAISVNINNTSVATTVFGGGNGNVTGAITLTIGGSAHLPPADTSVFTGNVYGGMNVNSTAAAEYRTGDITLTVNGGTFNGSLVGGGRVAVRESSKNITHYCGKISMTVNAGAFSATENVYGGGFAISDPTMTSTGALSLHCSGVTLNWTGGVHGGINSATGRGIYLGSLSSRKTMVEVSGVKGTFSGGVAAYIYGGGYSDTGGNSKVISNGLDPYAVDITVDGTAYIGTIYGGGNTANNGGTSQVIGDVHISVRSCAGLEKVFLGGRSNNAVLGNAKLTVGGAQNFSFAADGSNVSADSKLSYDGYTGIFSGAVSNFDTVEVTNGAAVNYNNATGNFSGVGNWLFDLSTQLSGNLDAAFDLQSGVNNFTGDNVKLVVDTNSVSGNSWNVYSGSTAGINPANITLWDNHGNQLSFGTASGDWNLSYDSNSLLLSKLA